MSDKLLYLQNGRLEAIEGVPEFDPLVMDDSVEDWRFEVIGYQDDEGNWVLRRFGDNIITDIHPQVMPRGGNIGQLIKKKDYGAEWATPTVQDAGAMPYMGNPSENGLYRVANVSGHRYWGTGTEDQPLTVAQFKRLAIIMEFTQ